MYLKIKLPLEKLYFDTLNFSYPYTKFSCDKNKVFLGLQYRYEFINILIEINFNLSKDQILKTNYYKLISKKIDEYPRDGGINWVYDMPLLQVNRFIDTAKSIFKNGYITKKKSPIIYDFELHNPKHIERDKEDKVTTINYLKKDFQGIIEVRKIKNKYIVLNGHHRLAILKVLKDRKIKNIKDEIPTKIYFGSIKDFLKIFIF